MRASLQLTLTVSGRRSLPRFRRHFHLATKVANRRADHSALPPRPDSSDCSNNSISLRAAGDRKLLAL